MRATNKRHLPAIAVGIDAICDADEANACKVQVIDDAVHIITAAKPGLIIHRHDTDLASADRLGDAVGLGGDPICAEEHGVIRHLGSRSADFCGSQRVDRLGTLGVSVRQKAREIDRATVEISPQHDTSSMPV